MPEQAIPYLTVRLMLGILCLGLSSDAMADRGDLVWSTFLGGLNVDNGADIAVDGNGHVWVTGFTESDDFPASPGAFDTLLADRDAFVVQLDAGGNHLLAATLLGGEGWDESYSLSLDGMGRVYVAGYTRSADFPVTPGALDTSLEGYSDAFVAQLDSAGSLVSATLLGGSGDEWCFQIAADDSGRVTAVGSTGSIDFPATPGSADETHNGASDAFVARLLPSGQALEYAAFLGGSSDEWGWGVALDDSGCAYVTGYTSSRNFPTTPGAFDSTQMGPTDVFVARFDPTGASLRYATLLGGGFSDAARSIAVDAAGCACVTGYTYSADFPVTAGAFQDSMGIFGTSVFVTQLDPWGKSLIYSTFLAGEGTESGYGLAMDDSRQAWVVGFTESEDFPVTAGSYDETHNGERDVFLCALDSLGRGLRYSTYMGGTQVDYAWDLAIGEEGRIYLVGYSRSDDYPTTAGAFQETLAGGDDVVVASLLPGPPVTMVQEPAQASVPERSGLHQNWPNPFNVNTQMGFQLSSPGTASLAIYNAAGQMVWRLVETRFPAGEHTVVWDGRDDDGRHVSSGVYFCRLESGDLRETIKMTLLR